MHRSSRPLAPVRRASGARDAREAGEGEQADWDLSIVDEDEIGGGNGLDEAELADIDPVDGRRWG